MLHSNLLQIIVSCLITFIIISHSPEDCIAESRTQFPEHIVSGKIINSVTGQYLRDTVNIDIMTLDSTVIMHSKARIWYKNWPDESSIVCDYELPVHTDGSNLIIKLAHPDYETIYYRIKSDKFHNDNGYLKIRRLSRFEKSIMLGEVAVQASIVQFVNKGDTISYNADAFQVAQGSMLDVLLQQMPGVKLNEGQITVNGRFVDKLMLNGSDFFQGDQLVLLQNLPAYTVKSINVYEEAGGITEVLGKAAMDLKDRDKYVMDVRLKKGYNAGWIANAEAGGGTHERYRARAFGSGYTRSIALSAYGYLNNLNEDRTPGNQGRWNSANNSQGITEAKGLGISYSYQSPSRNLEIAGDAAAQYGKERLDKIISSQNFLVGGDTYSRQWSNRLNRDLMLRTNHKLVLRPKTGNAYYNELRVYFNRNTNRDRQNEVKGEFADNPDSIDDLRRKLIDGWLEQGNPLNRYNYLQHTDIKSTSVRWNQSSTFAIGRSSNGITISSDGFVRNNHTDGDDSYLLQYAGSDPSLRNRTNPRKGHSYRYWIGTRLTFRLNAWLTINPFYAFCHEYHNDDNRWYIENADASKLLPSMRSETMMQLDPRNSYYTRRHHTHHYISLPIGYYREMLTDGQTNSSVSLHFQPGMNIMTPKLYYHGCVDEVISRKYVTPEAYFEFFWFLPGMAPRFNLEYKILSKSIDLTNLVNVTYDSDPLNLRMGNPDLKYSYTHRFDAGYQSEKWIFDRLLVNAYLAAEIYERQVAMSYAYDEAKGVRTYRPVNVDGNRTGWFSLQTDLMLDRQKRFKFSNWLWLQPVRSVDMVSTDDFASTQENMVNSFVVRNDASIEYNRSGYMVAVEGGINTRRASSSSLGFDPFRVTRFNYGIRGRAALPGDFEISTDLKMYSTRGFDDRSMNVNQLVWNARITKSILNNSLMFILDGYDMLGRIKNISYNVNAQGRTETWVNNIPSYVMLSLRWNFAKKPKE